MSRTWCGAVGVAALSVVAGSALAEGVSVEIPIEGISSWDERGEATNVVLTVDVSALAGFGAGAPAVVTGVGFDLTLETFGFSWLSEAEIALTDSSDSAGITLNPGDGDDMPGIETYSAELFKLAPEERFALSDGILRLEFYENFDDVPGEIDSEWNGTLFVQVIPSPGSGVALGALALAGRRRR